MAAAFTKQVLENGARSYRVLYTCVFTVADAPITNYLAADPTSTGDMGVNIQGQVLYPGAHLKIWELHYDMSNDQAVELIWDATTPQAAYIANGQGAGKQSFKKRGGLSPSASGVLFAGATGKVLFTTLGPAAAVAGDFISLEVWYKKDIKQ